MTLSMFQVDAFSSKLFGGNPAAVIPLQNWLDEAVMQQIAEENNLSETVFFISDGEDYYIRWFTPKTEIKLCGHATLAAAFVLFEHLGYQGCVEPMKSTQTATVRFNSLSGVLSVARLEQEEGVVYRLDFPSQPPKPCATPDVLAKALGCKLLQVSIADDYLVEVESQTVLARLEPDFGLLKQLDSRGVIVTAKGDGELDFVSRFFVPKIGIDEDPVTGSAHTNLTPYWAQRLGKTQFKAKQISARGGDLDCELKGDRVTIAGQARLFMQGEIVL